MRRAVASTLNMAVALLVAGACGGQVDSVQDQHSDTLVAVGAGPGTAPSASKVAQSGGRRPATRCRPRGLRDGASAPQESGWNGSTLTIITAESMDGFTAYSPAQLKNSPCAMAASYIFLENDSDAVRLDGPTFAGSAVTDLAALLSPENPKVEFYEWERLRFTLNSRLEFDIQGGDFERETTLGWVELTTLDNAVQSAFILLGTRDGVINHVSSVAYVDGVKGSMTSPNSIEVRSAGNY